MRSLPMFDACRLQGDDRALRMQEWAEAAGSRIISRQTIGSGLKMLLRPSPGLLETLGRLAEQERTCCPHLEFSVSRTPGGITVEIRERGDD